MADAGAIMALTHQLKRLPGVGGKSAMRMAYFILREKNEYAARLASAILEASDKVGFCDRCGDLSEFNPCRACADLRRDRSLLCIVEQIQDKQAIESSGEFRGLYHILQGAISPLNGVGPDDLRIPELLSRTNDDSYVEIILALNNTVDGEATALYLQKLLVNSNAKLTRLATGIAAGGDLEYSDRETIARALRGRMEF